jgi:YfiH family protein
VSAPADRALACLRPAWPAPDTVRAAFTLRSGGVSADPFDTLNVGAHVGDLPERVGENRARVRAALTLPHEPRWLEQVHGRGVVEIRATQPGPPPRADAAIARERGAVAVIQVADCLPVLLAAADGSCVAAAHAGWRGLAAGVLEATVERLATDPRGLIAWLGPGIGPQHFEVGAQVREAFLAQDPAAAVAFRANERGRWQCDLVALARQRLQQAGVRQVFGGEWCTYADRARFFSYRRDGQCGRMAALVWLV